MICLLSTKAGTLHKIAVLFNVIYLHHSSIVDSCEIFNNNAIKPYKSRVVAIFNKICIKLTITPNPTTTRLVAILTLK